MWAIFFNSAVSNAIANGYLIPFYSLILKNEPLKEQLRLSSLIMVIYGFGQIAGGPILGVINDKLGGDRAVALASIIISVLLYSTLILCNEIHTFNFLCFLSGFICGIADTSQVTQISIMIAAHFSDFSAEVFAIFNIVKMAFMSSILMIGGYIATQEAFRWFYAGFGILCVASLVLLYMTFEFKSDRTKERGNNDSELKDLIVEK
jgi:MFS family permease